VTLAAAPASGDGNHNFGAVPTTWAKMRTQGQFWSLCLNLSLLLLCAKPLLLIAVSADLNLLG